MTIKTALRAPLSVLKKVLPLVNAKNASVLLGILTLFGIVAPETATKIRNDVLAPWVAVSSGDLVSVP